MRTLRQRIQALEDAQPPHPCVIMKIAEGYPIDQLDLWWWPEPFLRGEGESEPDFIERCRAWAIANFSKGYGAPAVFFHEPHF